VNETRRTSHRLVTRKPHWPGLHRPIFDKDRHVLRNGLRRDIECTLDSAAFGTLCRISKYCSGHLVPGRIGLRQSKPLQWGVSDRWASSCSGTACAEDLIWEVPVQCPIPTGFLVQFSGDNEAVSRRRGLPDGNQMLSVTKISTHGRRRNGATLCPSCIIAPPRSSFVRKSGGPLPPGYNLPGSGTRERPVACGCDRGARWSNFCAGLRRNWMGSRN
jgi:hypothetical protein